MFKTISALFFFSSLFSQPSEFPEVIDFGKLRMFQQLHHFDQTDTWTWNLGNAALKAGISAFNDSPEIGSFLYLLNEQYQIDGVVETGTYLGATASFFALHFKQVHTIEVMQHYYDIALDLFKDVPHVLCYHGTSPEVMSKILPFLKHRRLLFYLDAHGPEYWPLLDELEEIRKTHQNHCIIVIDDFKVPGRGDIGYDAYGANECSYEYIKNMLSKIFTDYSIHYLIPKDITRKAKFVAIPKIWRG